MRRWLAVVLIVACGTRTGPTTPDRRIEAREALEASIRGAMQPDADPCDDFYQHACGGWIESATIPPDRTRWGRSFDAIAERNREDLRRIVERAAADPGDDPGLRKLGDFHAACMDTERIAERGTEPLDPLLAAAEAVGARPVLAVAGELQAAGVAVLLDMWVEADFRDPELQILHLFQGGLALPDRDYYLEEPFAAQRASYEEHVARMLGLLGDAPDRARRGAAAVLAIETALARSSRRRAELRDPEAIYHRMDRAALARLTPGLDWQGYLTALGHPDIQAINVATPEFFQALAELVRKTSPEDLRTYVRWHVAHHYANALPDAFVEEHFAFFGRTLAGQQEIEARWKRCLAAADTHLGHLLGKAYVDERFAGRSKEIALEMIRRVEAAFEGQLDDVDWMDDPTRARAREKAAAITNKIGYPSTWRDYGPLAVSRDDHLGNLERGHRFLVNHLLSQVGGPVDREEWFMTPPTVNAYYNPLQNEIVFPAGILQPPFFDATFPAAMNYGAMGMVMGHEISHGFDDSGRKFDPRGRMVEWWPPDVAARFEEAASCIARQYDAYEVAPGQRIHGELTLGENIGDHGGIKAAHGAYASWVREHGEEPRIAGLSGEELFFVAFAQSWCTLVTPERERMLLTTDTHSPARFRVNGPLRNFPRFAEVFGCEVGSAMAPEEVCEVW